MIDTFPRLHAKNYTTFVTRLGFQRFSLLVGVPVCFTQFLHEWHVWVGFQVEQEFIEENVEVHSDFT
jgi:hypothetical protein